METLTKKLLQTIVKHCNAIENTQKHFGFAYIDFDNNVIYQNAVLTPVAQIGELVKKLPDEFKTQHSSIPWRNIAGMRDILIHNYETIDKVILWNVAEKEIPKIKSFCLDLLGKEN